MEIQRYVTISNYYLSPISIETKNVTQGSEISYHKDHPFSEYLKHVKNFKFIITKYDFEKTRTKINMLISRDPSYLPNYRITNKASQDLGWAFGAPYGRGEVIFLPPVTEISISEGINKIIDTFHGKTAKLSEPAPQWVSSLRITGLNEIDGDLSNAQSKKTEIEKEIETIQKKKDDLLGHYRLLYAESDDLEESVHEALKILGFNEIKRIRNDNDDDGVFEFKTISDYKYGVIEIKGAKTRTSQQNITQCSKWVDERFTLDNKISKGIFIPNQHRLIEYPASKKDRLHFEPNELGYAKMKDICIIPSCVLFEAVNKTLEGKIKSRTELEKLIAETNGILSEL